MGFLFLSGWKILKMALSSCEKPISPQNAAPLRTKQEALELFHQARMNAGATATIPAKVSAIVTARRTGFCQPLK